MITVSDLQHVAGAKSRDPMLSKIALAFNKYAVKYGLTRKENIADCLAHICVETGGFRHLAENMNYSEKGLRKTFSFYRNNPSLAKAHARKPELIANTAYADENRSPRYKLGNTQTGDGWRFRGSGPGQITGRNNFEAFYQATGIDVVSSPDLLRDPDTGMKATLLLWQRWNMNQFKGGSIASRKKWNGGQHGLKKYQAAFQRAMQLNLSVSSNVAPSAVSEEDETIEELISNPQSSLLPRHRPKASEQEVRQLLEDAKHLLPADRRDDAVFMVGVDDYYSKMAKRNVYDSAIFIVTPDDVKNYNANCDPSKHRKGIAQLKTNQAVLYAPGPHGFKRKGGPYPAFRQKGKCTVIRDKLGEDTGVFWINIHRGGLNTTSSAGCQTIPPHQWAEFKTDGYRALDDAGQKDFYYLLLPNSSFLEAAEKVKTASKPPMIGKAATGVLVGGAVVISAALEKFSGWLSNTLEWIGGIF